MDKQRWLVYALGHGWGHLNRSLALARLAAHTRTVDVVCNTPYAELLETFPVWNLIRQDRNIQIVRLASQSPTEIRTYFETQVSWENYQCLIVDTFPRGLVGELSGVLPHIRQIPRILVARALNPKYVEKFALKDFVKRNYTLVIDPGERLVANAASSDENIYDYRDDTDLSSISQTAGTVTTPPWLIQDSNDLPSTKSMRNTLGVPDDKPFVLVVAAGQRTELEFYGRLTETLSQSYPDATIKCLAVDKPHGLDKSKWISYWPGIDCISACDIAVGGAGYNTINECLAVNVPLIAIPQPRLYDLQGLRAKLAAQEGSDLNSVVNLIGDYLRNWSGTKNNGGNSHYKNGVADALFHIETVLSSANQRAVLREPR